MRYRVLLSGTCVKMYAAMQLKDVLRVLWSDLGEVIVAGKIEIDPVPVRYNCDPMYPGSGYTAIHMYKCTFPVYRGSVHEAPSVNAALALALTEITQSGLIFEPSGEPAFVSEADAEGNSL